MDNLNKYFEDSEKIMERIEQEFRRINQQSRQELYLINQYFEPVVNKQLENVIVSSGNDAIQTSDVEKNIQTSMKDIDVSTVNEETIAEINAEYQEQLKQEMSAEEISRFADEEQNNLEEMNVQEEADTQTQAFLSLIRDCESGTMLEIDKEVIGKCIQKSVKPGVKVKNKQKTRKMNENNVKKNILKFVGTCVVLSGVLTIGATYTDDIYANHLRGEALETYTETVYEPNTSKEWIYSDKGNRQIYVHDWKNLIEQTHKTYENPVVGFYMLYTKLDKESKNNYMDTIMAEFNLYYGTDYKDVEDILTQNNFKDFGELSKYVSFEIYRMHAEEEMKENEIQDSPTRG